MDIITGNTQMNLDRTFCASPHCKNECGRKMTEEERKFMIAKNKYVSWMYCCGEPDKNNEMVFYNENQIGA